MSSRKKMRKQHLETRYAYIPEESFVYDLCQVCKELTFMNVFAIANTINFGERDTQRLKTATIYIYIYLVLSFLPTESTEQPIRTGPTKGGFILPAMTCFKNNINLLHLLDCFWLMFLLHYIASRTNLDPPCAKVIGHILGPNL